MVYIRTDIQTISGQEGYAKDSWLFWSLSKDYSSTKAQSTKKKKKKALAHEIRASWKLDIHLFSVLLLFIWFSLKSAWLGTMTVFDVRKYMRYLNLGIWESERKWEWLRAKKLEVHPPPQKNVVKLSINCKIHIEVHGNKDWWRLSTNIFMQNVLN